MNSPVVLLGSADPRLSTLLWGELVPGGPSGKREGVGPLVSCSGAEVRPCRPQVGFSWVHRPGLWDQGSWFIPVICIPSSEAATKEMPHFRHLGALSALVYCTPQKSQ